MAPPSAIASGSVGRAPARTITPLRIFLALVVVLLVYTSTSRHRSINAGSQGKAAQADTLLSSSSSSSARPTALTRRIVAVADLHGDLEHALNVLRMAQVVHPSTQDWAGGQHDVLVSTGDIVDRGDDTIALYTLFERLRAQAGPDKVKNCLGNHEMMNALGDWRYVTRGDVMSFPGEDPVQSRRKAMSDQGWIGQAWLANYSVSHTIDLLPRERIESLQAAGQLPRGYTVPSANFVHGGIHPTYAHKGLDEINRLGTSLLRKALVDASLSGGRLPHDTTPDEEHSYGETGPFWYRGYAYEGEDVACKLADESRAALGTGTGGVDYLVMGHTPHFEGFIHRCKPPSIHLIDTGISRAYGGEQSALIFETSLALKDAKKATGSSTIEGDVKLGGGGGGGVWEEHRSLVALYKGRMPRVVYETTRIVAGGGGGGGDGGG